jgi:hypothetical protein
MVGGRRPAHNKTDIQQNTKREKYTVTLTGSRTSLILLLRYDTAIGPVSDDPAAPPLGAANTAYSDIAASASG